MIEVLKTNPICGADGGTRAAASPATSARQPAPRRTIGEPRMFIKVDFPDPDAPMMAMNSARAISSETPQRFDSTSPSV
jgi:hypothetical protein